MTTIGSTTTPDVSGRPAWLPWAAMAVVGTVFFVTEHSFDTSRADAFTQTEEQMLEAAEGGNLLRRIAYPLLGLLGATLLVLPARNRPHVDPLPLALAVALAGWCLLSLAWSIDRPMTLRRCVVLGCCVAGAAGLARRLRPRDLPLMGVVVPAVYLGLGVCAELALGTFRPWAGAYRFSGTIHPNTQGIHLAALCLSAVTLARIEPRRRVMYYGLFAVGLVFLILTKSRTTAAGLLFALVAIWTVTTPLKIKLFAGTGGSWLLCTIVLVLLLAGVDLEQRLASAALMGRAEQAESLTGRLPLWTELWRFMAARPLLGHGYGAFWTAENIAAVSEALQWGIREAHSSFVEAVLNLGVIGLGLALSLLLTTVVRSQQAYVRSRDPVWALVLGLWAFGFVNAFTESAMLMTSYFTFLLGLGVLCLALQRPLRPEDGVAETAPGTVRPLGLQSRPAVTEPVYGNPML